MFELARTGGERVAGDALMITTLVDGVDPAPRLLDLARDRALEADVRRSALFWVAQVASDRVGEHLAGIASAEAEDQEVRNAAVFALSQRPGAESVPALMELAQEAPHVRTRRQALFWLAQSEDPRVADFFADLILRGPLGG
jgi:HEAT repeat protein